MSADNWGVCPRCKREAEERYSERVEAARESYARVPLHEFERRQAEAAEPAEDIGETLREDYEFYIDEVGGWFHVRYKAECDRCGFTHKFSHDGPTEESSPR